MTAPNLAYLWGDDDHGLDRAVARFVARLVEAHGPMDTWLVRGAETDPAGIGERVATAPLFGGGTVVVVSEPGPLVRSTAGRDALVALVGAVAPGNALVLVDGAETGARRPAALDRLRDAVAAAGGEVREVRAPRESEIGRWIEREAHERGIRLGPGAAAELAARVGATVRENDVDRRRMAALAVGELDKLALYRPDAVVEKADVAALVSEAVTASTWAFLDAVGERRARPAADLLDRLLETTPEPVLLVQLHRRIRELLEVGDLLATGTPPGGLVRALKLKPFRAERLATQAARWRLPELDAALRGLLDLDAMVKGAEPASPRQVRLAFQLWLRDHVAAGTPAASGAGGRREPGPRGERVRRAPAG